MYTKFIHKTNYYYNILLISIFSFLFPKILNAKVECLYSPEGSSFCGSTCPEFKQGEMAYYDSCAQAYINTFQLNAVMVDHSSATYSCHDYAWCLSEGNGGRCHLSIYSITDSCDQAYSNDGLPSYVSASESEATLIYYFDANHSARIIQNSYPYPISGGRNYVAKWGEKWGLYQHAKDNDPYFGTIPFFIS